MYSYLNEKLKGTHAVNVLVDSDGEALTNDAANARLFASFFSSVFREDGGILSDFSLRSDSQLSDVDIEVDLIVSAINSTSDKLSLTPDLIPSYLLKRMALAVAYSSS